MPFAIIATDPTLTDIITAVTGIVSTYGLYISVGFVLGGAALLVRKLASAGR